METGEDFNLDCAICYSHLLSGHAPERTCDNANCGKQFHLECLYDWLQSDGESHKSLCGKMIVGKCPYCEEKISGQQPI